MLLRQGDLLFKKIDKVPSGFEPNTNPVLLRGEATGHSHRLVNGTIFRAKYTAEIYIKVGENGRVIHEEHKMLELPQGVWMVIRQREYNPYRIMNVMD